MGRKRSVDTRDLVADILHFLPGLLELNASDRADVLELRFQLLKRLLCAFNLTGQGFLLFDGLLCLRSLLQLL